MPVRMKHSDDYLTIRFANPATGQVTPSPPTSSPPTSTCKATCSRHMHPVRNDTPSKPRFSTGEVTQIAAHVESIGAAQPPAPHPPDRIFKSLTRKPFLGSPELLLESRSSDETVVMPSPRATPRQIDYSELSCSALSGNDPLLLSNMRVPEGRRDVQDQGSAKSNVSPESTASRSPPRIDSRSQHEQTAKLSPAPSVARTAFAQLAASGSGSRLRKPVKSRTKRHISVERMAAAEDMDDPAETRAATDTGTEDTREDKPTTVEPRYPHALPKWLLWLLDQLGPDAMHAVKRDAQVLFEKTTERRERARALRTVLLGVAKVLMVLDGLLIAWRIARAVIEVIELCLWPLIALYKLIRCLMP